LATKDINLDSTAAVSDYTDEQAGKKETAGLAAAATTLKNTKGGKVADKFEARKSLRSPKRTGSSAKSLPKKDPAMKARAPVNFTNEQDLKQKETQEVKAAAVLKKEGLAKDNAADDATEMEAMDEKAKTKGGEAAKKRVANAEDKKRKVDSDARKKAAKDEEAKNKTENTAMKRAAIEESKKKRADADAIKKAAKEDQIKKKAEEVAKSGERWEAEAKEEKARWAAEAGVKKIDLEAAATVEAEKIKRWTADAEAKNTEEEARAAAEVAQKKRWAAEAILEKKQWAEQSTKKQEGEEAKVASFFAAAAGADADAAQKERWAVEAALEKKRWAEKQDEEAQLVSEHASIIKARLAKESEQTAANQAGLAKIKSEEALREHARKEGNGKT
jgi:hypothetical protein